MVLEVTTHVWAVVRLLDCPFPLTEKSGRQWLERIEVDEDGRELVDSDLRVMDALQQEIDALDKRLAQRVYQDERVKLHEMGTFGVYESVQQASMRLKRQSGDARKEQSAGATP